MVFTNGLGNMWILDTGCFRNICLTIDKMLNDRKININGDSLRIWEQTVIRNSISNYKWTNLQNDQ